MEKATQKNRLLSIITPKGEDYLLINKLKVKESLSELYKIEVELLFDEGVNTTARKPTTVDLNAILGQPATISIDQHNQGTRYFNGIFESISFSGRTANFSFFNAVIVPQIWELTQVFQSRIFQQKSVKDILLEVFAGYSVNQKLRRDYKPRNYCVQYNETDFEFASRLMEEEGISYYFEFSANSEKMVIVDNFQTPQDCPNKSEIPTHNEDLTKEIFETAIRGWNVVHRLQTGKVTLWDYHFQFPKKKLEATRQSRINFGDRNMEIYKFPGGYARKADGINKSGGEQSSDLQNIFDDNSVTVKNQMEAIDAQHKVIYGTSNCNTMTAGHRFHLKNHPDNDYNIPYILLSISHEVDQSPFYMSSDVTPIPYNNSFSCIPHGSSFPEFRPLPKTPKPIVYGSQTAIVVGPAGEEIFTDKYGRVKVQFHWDRYGKANSDSSCWVRVAQSLAGNKWGGIFIPRIGMEVIVHFLEGNPDLPIITGCVYNPDTMPPYTLPDEKTKSTLKTNSSKGGGGFNEFRIEDKKGSEQIFLHGEKDLDIRIKNDAKELIKKDRHLIVEGNQYEKVKSDKHLTVTGNHSEKIDGEFGLKVGANIQEKAGQKIASDAGTEIHLKAGMKVVVEAGTQLSLKVGGNFIDINPGGIFIKGTMVMLNSGGMAGSGGGSNPNAPTDPKEADTADPGARIPPPQPPPPTTPRTRSQKSAAMTKAAQNGTPFVSNASSSPDKKKELEKAISKLAEDAKKTADKIGKKAENTASEAAQKAKQAVKELKKSVTEAKSELEAKKKEAVDKFNQAAKLVKQTVNDGISKLNKAADKGKDALQKVNQQAKEKLEKIEEGFEKGKEALHKAEEKAAETVKKGKEALHKAEQKAEEAKKAVEEKIDDVKKGLDDLKDKFNPF